MTINRLVRTASLALLGLVLVTAIIFAVAVNAIRIGGTHENAIELSAELEADILPPPLFIVEPYAVTMEGYLHEEKRAASLERLKEMRRIYEERKAYWASRALEPDVRAGLDEVIRNADLFWRALDARAIPVMKTGDPARYDAALEALAKDYNGQRAAISELLVATGRYKAKVRDEAASALTIATVVLIGLGCALLGGVLIYSGLLRRRVVQPLSELTEVAGVLSGGQRADIPHLARDDELGGLAKAFDHFVTSSDERAAAVRRDAAEKSAMIAAISSHLGRIADGDLRQVMDDELEGEFGAVGGNLNRAILALRDMVQHVVGNAGSIRVGAREIADASSDLSSRTQSNAAAIEETTAALTDVDKRVASTRDAAQSTAQSAGRAKTAVELGREKARSAATTMEEVREAAASVDGVMEALDRIAFQTRVLAMNAAVEAGHAGEAGKGFAVVADLVSQLATRAEQEARNAREQLTTTTDRIAVAAASVGEVEDQFAAIVTDVVKVADLIEGLTSDARAQSEAIAEISSAMRQMDISTQQNAAMVEETSAAAAMLLRDAEDLVERAETFKWNRRERNVAVAVDRRAGTGDGESLRDAA